MLLRLCSLSRLRERVGVRARSVVSVTRAFGAPSSAFGTSCPGGHVVPQAGEGKATAGWAPPSPRANEATGQAWFRSPAPSAEPGSSSPLQQVPQLRLVGVVQSCAALLVLQFVHALLQRLPVELGDRVQELGAPGRLVAGHRLAGELLQRGAFLAV